MKVHSKISTRTQEKDFVQNHEALESESTRFVGNETKIPCVRSKVKDLDNYTGISLSAVLQSKEKHEIFEVVRDPIISPKELNNAEVQLYFTKVSWSHNSLQITPGTYGKSQHILGVLDSHFRLQLFTKKFHENAQDGKGLLAEEDWDVCVDFTQSYRNMLFTQFWSINVEDEAEFSSTMFTEYKRRMYDLSTVDFTWLSPWEDAPPLKNKFESSFITAHASGDICIWKVCLDPLSKDKSKYFLTLEFRRNLIPDEIVCSMHFHKFSSSFGILAIGTTVGRVRVFKIYHNSVIARSMKPIPDAEDVQPQKYQLDGGIVVCEKDKIEIQSIYCDSREGSSEGYLYIFKHPNFLMPFKFELAEPNDIIIGENVEVSRVVQGTLAGVAMLPKQGSEDTVAVTVSQRGILKWMNIIEGALHNEASIDLSLLEDQSASLTGEQLKLKKRFQFGGIAVSPNMAMLCVSKTLAEYYDHLILRTPSILQFHSLFPARNVWSRVYEKCLTNNFLLQQMRDVLASFRMLMTLSDQHLKEVLDWAVPLSAKSINELQILLWVLRVQPRVNQDQLVYAFNLRKEELGPFLTLKHQRIRTYRRETLVSDRIMQLRCLAIVEKIIENPEKYELSGNTTNQQSLMMMYEYLESKAMLIEINGPLPLKPRVLVDPPPRQPACSLCGNPTKMTSVENAKRWRPKDDFTVEHEIDEEEIDGVLWHEQEHQQKSRNHPLMSCILSLLPVSFPYRKCNFCGTVCSTRPSFNQEPVCPLCNDVMQAYEGSLNEEELNTMGEDEIKKFVAKIQHKEKSKGKDKQTQEVAKPSRKARIEKMYVDS